MHARGRPRVAPTFRSEEHPQKNKNPKRSPAQRVRFGEEGQGSGADGGEAAAEAKADFALTRSPLHPTIDLHPVGACFARPRATAGRPYVPFGGTSAEKQKPKAKPSAAGSVWRGGARERRGWRRGSRRSKSGLCPDPVAPTSHHRPPSRRGVLCTPAGDRGSPLRSVRRNIRRKTKTQSEAQRSGFGLERRGKGAARMAARQPPKQKRTLP